MHGSALLVDFYQLTMAYAYFKSGKAEKRAAFHLFFRRQPFHGGFAIACGLESVVEYIEKFRFSSEEITYLKNLERPTGGPYFSEDFLEFLTHFRPKIDLYAVPEGTSVFAFEPILRVEGPLIACQLLESPLLNLINFPTLIATKAARVSIAAEGDPVFEFGLRRAQGVDGALTASRAAYIGGCVATSNVLAGKKFNIPVQGTQAHSWIMAFPSEKEAFQAYQDVYGESSVFLVDTYDTIAGVKTAIEVAKNLKEEGKNLLGIRLDSGDLAYLSISARELLDAAGMQDTKILASNELDEFVISALKRQGAKISHWGVGTNLVTGKECSALDGVYKLSSMQNEEGKWEHVLKLSEQMTKISNPGRMQVRRFIENGCYIGDVLYDIDIGISSPYENSDIFDETKEIYIRPHQEYKDLLVPIFKDGQCVYTLPSLDEIQKTARKELDALPGGVLRFLNPHIYPTAMEKRLFMKKVELIKKVRKKTQQVRNETFI